MPSELRLNLSAVKGIVTKAGIVEAVIGTNGADPAVGGREGQLRTVEVTGGPPIAVY